MFIQRLKIISLIILTCYFSIICRDFSYASKSIHKNSLNRNIGTVVDTFNSQKANNKKIFIIEDIHCDRNAQLNIVKILEYIKINLLKIY